MFTIEYLLNNSNLPGPRGNLELLYDFSKNADRKMVDACLKHIKNDTSNSPEEFVGMCGILGYAILNKANTKMVISFIKKYASHPSWRIREAVAMAIQEISEDELESSLENMSGMINGNYYEQRAVVAGLCEPKLLKDEVLDKEILNIMELITHNLNHDNKLGDSETSLRKALGYGWSVVVAASPNDGKKYFERLFDCNGKHIKWIINENLKKNRIIKMDSEWIDKCKRKLEAM